MVVGFAFIVCCRNFSGKLWFGGIKLQTVFLGGILGDILSAVYGDSNRSCMDSGAVFAGVYKIL